MMIMRMIKVFSLLMLVSVLNPMFIYGGVVSNYTFEEDCDHDTCESAQDDNTIEVYQSLGGTIPTNNTVLAGCERDLAIGTAFFNLDNALDLDAKQNIGIIGGFAGVDGIAIYDAIAFPDVTVTYYLQPDYSMEVTIEPNGAFIGNDGQIIYVEIVNVNDPSCTGRAEIQLEVLDSPNLINVLLNGSVITQESIQFTPGGNFVDAYVFGPYCEGDLLGDITFEVDRDFSNYPASSVTFQDVDNILSSDVVFSANDLTAYSIQVIPILNEYVSLSYALFNFGPNGINEDGSGPFTDDCSSSIGINSGQFLIYRPRLAINDLCTEAIEVVEGEIYSNLCMNPETDCDGSGNTSHDVWFTHTLEAIPGELIDLTINIVPDATNVSLAGITDASIGVYYGDCDNIAACDMGATNPIITACDIISNGSKVELTCIDPADYMNSSGVPTLVFFVASDTDEDGEFTIEIEETLVVNAPNNDICSGAQMLSLGITNIDNSCASNSINQCGADESFNDVWYKYRTSDSTTDVTIELNSDGTSTSASQVSVIIFINDCPASITDVGLEYCEVLDVPITDLNSVILECIPPASEILIAFISEECDAGSFIVDLSESERTLGVLSDYCIDDQSGNEVIVSLDQIEAPLNAPNGNWEWVTNSSDISIVNGGGPDSELMIPTTTNLGLYTLRYVILGSVFECSLEVSFSVFSQPRATLADNQIACNTIDSSVDVEGQYLLETSDLNGSNNIPIGAWFDDMGLLSSGQSINSIDFTGLADGTSVTFTYQLPTNISDTCNPVSESIIFEVSDCTCPETTQPSNLCTGAGSIVLEELIDNSITGVWTIIDGPNGNVTSIINESGELSADANTLVGTYTIQFIPDNPVTGCNDLLLTTEMFEVIAQPTATLTQSQRACTSNTGVNVELNLESGSTTGGIWSDDQGLISGGQLISKIDFSGLTSGDIVTFTYTIPISPDSPCSAVQESMEYMIEDCTCPETIQPSNLCIGAGSIVLEELIDNSITGVWTIIDGPNGDVTSIINGSGELSADANTLVGTYTIQFIPDNPVTGCNDLLLTTEMFEVIAQPTATLTASQRACTSDTGVNVELNLEPGSTTGGIWSDNQGLLSGGQLITAIDFSGLMNGDIVTFTYTIPISPDSPCNPISESMIFEVSDCTCPETIQPGNLCIGAGSIVLEELIDNSITGVWTIIDGPNGDVTSIINGSGELSADANTLDGTYTIQFIPDNPVMGCNDLLLTTEMFEVIAQPAATLTASQRACTSDTGVNVELNLEPGSTTGGIWSDDQGLLSGGQLITAIDFSGLMSGDIVTFTYTIPISPDNPCSTVQVSMVYTIEDCTCPETSQPRNLCIGAGSIVLDELIDNSITGVWTVIDGPNGDVTSIIHVSGELSADANTLVGTYTIQFIPDNPVMGCNDLSITTEMFEVIAQSTASIGTNQVACHTDTNVNVELNLEPGSTIGGIWSDDQGLIASGQLINTIDFSGLMVGDIVTFTYTIPIPPDSPCPEVEESIMYTIGDCSCLTIANPLPVCNDGGTVNLSALVTTVGGVWAEDPGNGVTGILNGDIVNFDFSILEGTYIYHFTPNELQNPSCPATVPVSLEVMPSVSAGIGQTVEVCMGIAEPIVLGDLLFEANPGGIWTETSVVPSTGSAFNHVDGEFEVDGQNAGRYMFAYTLSANPPCMDHSSVVTVVIYDNPLSDAGDDILLDCSLTSATLGGLLTSTGANITYLWTLNGQAISNVQNPQVSEVGTYTLEVFNIDTECSDFDDVIVGSDTSVPILEIDYCTSMGVGTLFLTNVSGQNTPLTIEVMDSDGNISLIPYDVDLTEIIDLLPGTYTISLLDNIDCRSVQTIDITSELAINYPNDVEFVMNGDLVTLSLDDFSINETEVLFVEWIDQDGEVLCSGLPDDCRMYEFEIEDTEVLICLSITDFSGCINEDCVSVQLLDENIVYTPNIFIPGDDLNGFVYPQTDKNAVIGAFRIYDRWGNLVFVRENFNTNIAEMGWDGTYNEVLVEQGVYVYIYDVTFPNGEIRTVAHDITVIK